MNPYRRPLRWYSPPRPPALRRLGTFCLTLFVLAFGGAALGTFAPVLAAPIFTAPIPAAITVPPCGCADDAPAFNRAMASGRPVTAQRGATYTIATSILPPSNAELHLAGATFNSAVTAACTRDSGATTTWASTICTVDAGGTTTTLAAQPAVGATSISVTSSTGLSVGGYIVLLVTTSPAPQMGQTFTVASITGSGPYTVGIADGRTVSFAYPTSATNVINGPDVPHDVHVYGEGAVINVTSLAQWRGFQLQGCLRCSLSDVRITGTPGIGGSFDLGGLHNTAERVTVAARVPVITGAAAAPGTGAIRVALDATSGFAYPTGYTSLAATIQGVTGTGGLPAAMNGPQTFTLVDPTHVDLVGTTFVGGYTSGGQFLTTLSGLMSESCEGCRYIDSRIRGAALGLQVFASVGSQYVGADIGAPCSAGAIFDDNRGYASLRSTADRLVVNGCGGYGGEWLDASSWKVSNSHFSGNALDGVRVGTDVSGVPDKMQFVDVTADNNGANGFHFVNATRLTASGINASGNGTAGVVIEAGASTVSINGGVLSGNAQGVYVVGGGATNWISLANLFLDGNTGYGVYLANGGGGTYRTVATNVRIAWAGSGTVYGWELANSGRVDLTNCHVDFTGTSGVNLAFDLAGPTATPPVWCNACTVAASGGTTFGFYTNGTVGSPLKQLKYTPSSDPTGAGTATYGTTGSATGTVTTLGN